MLARILVVLCVSCPLIVLGHARGLLQGQSGTSGNLPFVHGSGSTAAAVVWQSVIANATANANAPISLTYDAVGSGQGQTNLVNKAYDYAISDVPFTTTAYNALPRSILQIPFALSAFDAIHSIAGLTTPLRLTAGTLGAILQCTITRWDDPAIKAVNPNVQLPSADIFPVGRVEPSGSTAQITNYLSTNPEWALGQGFTVNWPKCVQRVQGTNGIIAYLQAHPNGIGYGEYGLAAGLGLVALQNAAGAYVRPSEAFLANISDVFGEGLHFPNSSASAAWANTSVAGTGRLAFPVTGLEYFNIDANLTGKGYPQGVMLKELALYMLSDAVQKNLPFFQFAALPDPLRNLALHDVNNIPVPKRPPDADAQNLPEAWINVYKPFYTSAPFVATSNTT